MAISLGWMHNLSSSLFSANVTAWLNVRVLSLSAVLATYAPMAFETLSSHENAEGFSQNKEKLLPPHHVHTSCQIESIYAKYAPRSMEASFAKSLLFSSDRSSQLSG